MNPKAPAAASASGSDSSSTSGPVPVPGPGGGRFAQLVNVVRMRQDRLGFLAELASYGELAFAQLGPVGLYVTTSPDHVKEVLVNQARKVKKGRGLQRAKHILGEGLLTSEGEYHLRQRRLSQPAFHKLRLVGYSRAMVDFAARFRERLSDGKSLDLHEEMMRLTLAIVGKTLFDSDVEAQAGEVGEAMANFMTAFTFMLLPFSELLEKLPLPPVRRLSRARAVLDRLIYGLIAERRQSGRDHGDLLSMLIAAQDEEGGGQMNDTQLRDECITLLLAGHETTANALSWTFYLLSQHPAVETKLFAEIDRVLGGGPSGRLPALEDLPQLPYAEQVFAEALRLYPPAWATAREVVEPITLGNHLLPPGALVLASPWLIHRSARFYPDPTRFDPERFTPEAKAARPKFAYFPFGAGPRNCIGESFAWMEGVLVLVTLLQRFRFRLTPGQRVEPDPSITLRPKHGLRMQVQARS